MALTVSVSSSDPIEVQIIGVATGAFVCLKTVDGLTMHIPGTGEENANAAHALGIALIEAASRVKVALAVAAASTPIALPVSEPVSAEAGL